MTPLINILVSALREIADLSIFAVAWIISFQFARQRRSRAILMISTGFLVKLAVDGAWDAFYYVLLGGPYGIFSSAQAQGLSVQNIAQIFFFYYLMGTLTSAVSLALMVFFILYGAMGEVKGQPAQTGQTITLGTPSITGSSTTRAFAEPATREVRKNL